MLLNNRPREPIFKWIAYFEKKAKEFENKRKEKAGKIDIKDYFAEKPAFMDGS